MNLVFILLVFLAPLSQGFTLDEALQNAKVLNDEIIGQQQNTKLAELAYKTLKQQQDYQINLNTKLGFRESLGEKFEDNSVFLSIKKNLFNNAQTINSDFSKSNIKVNKLRSSYLKLTQKIAIIQAFSAASLVDLELSYLTQVLALSAVKQAHIKEDIAIGLASEIALVEAQAKMRLDNANRQEVEDKQFSTRESLQELLTETSNLDLLELPVFTPYFNEKILTPKYWRPKLQTHNNLLVIMRLELTSLQHKKQQLKKSWSWSIDGFARLGEQSFNKDKEGSYRVGLLLNIPLNNEKLRQEIDKLTLLITQKQSKLKAQEVLLQQAMLDLSLQAKSTIRRYQALKTEQDYLSFNLDRASLEYEMRLSRNIGNAMILVTKNELVLATTAFDLMLVIEQMNLLTQGHLL